MDSILWRGAWLCLGQGVSLHVNQVINKVCLIVECLGRGKCLSVLLPRKPLPEVLCVHAWTDTYPTLICTFVSLHGCGWQLRALVLWKCGFLLLHLALLSSYRHAARETLCWPALTRHQRDRECTCGHWSATQPWRWDKGSRRAKALLSGGRVTATQLEVAGIVYGAGTVQSRRNCEVGAVRMRVCNPNWEGTFSSVGLAAVLLQEPLCSLKSHSCSSAHEQPTWPGAREAFGRKGNDVIVRKTWSVSHVCLWAPAPSVRTLPG